MIATSHPDTMTVEERRQEISRILATGLVRYVQQARMAPDSSSHKSSPLLPIGLDVPAKLRLSVSR